MSKKSNPTAIGAFIIGAVGLLVIAVLVFGGSELLENKTRAVTYFPGSVKGLRVGSNVSLRGVRIGYVSDIQLLGDASTLETTVEVTMEILPDSFRFTSRGKLLEKEKQPALNAQDIVDAGLRAQLDVESLVTGQLYVDLDFHPDKPPLYRSENPPYVEIPSIPSDIQEVVKKVQMFIADIQGSMDFQEMSERLESILSGLDELANSPDLRESLAGINRIVNDEDMRELAASLQTALADARSTLRDARTLFNNADARIDPLMDELMPAIEQLDSALAAGEDALSSASMQIKGDAELTYGLTTTLDELQGAARSLRIFLDYLERNPEALIRGKQP